MRKAIVLNPDAETAHTDLRAALEAAGLEVLDTPGPDGGLIVMLPTTADQSASSEDDALAVLRAHGYVGQWEHRTRSEPAGS
jgi:hypothetical protein